MFLLLSLFLCAVLLRMTVSDEAAIPSHNTRHDDSDDDVYPSNNMRHVQKLRTYNREMFKVEHCETYHPVRANCKTILQRDPPTEEGRRYKICFAKCTLSAVCEDVQCSACEQSQFEYRQFPGHHGFKRWCRPVPCTQRGYVKWTDYSCRRERNCTLLHCKIGVRKVPPKELQPFTLQLLASRTENDAPESDTEDLGTLELGYEVQLGSVTLGSSVTFQTNVSIPIIPEDMYLLADATGSLEEAIKAVQKHFWVVMKARKAICPTSAFGVGFFRDESSKSGSGKLLKDGFSNLQTITRNATQVQRAVDTLEAKEGGDTPEAGLLALYRLGTDSSIGWREGSRKVVIIFGDAPQHEPVCIGDMKLCRSDVIKVLRAKGITVIAIQVGDPGMDAETSPYACEGLGSRQKGGQMSAITQLTNGVFVRNISQEFVVDAVTQATEHLNIRFEIDVSDCVPEYTVEFVTPVPEFVKYGDVVQPKMKITANGAACTSQGPKKCILKYIVGGVTISLQDISVDDVRDC